MSTLNLKKELSEMFTDFCQQKDSKKVKDNHLLLSTSSSQSNDLSNLFKVKPKFSAILAKKLRPAPLKGERNLARSSFGEEDPNNDQEEQELLEWLGRLRLLYGVPFNYLVANSALLPAESIRFFYLDENWIQALVWGACSIGDALTANKVKGDNAKNKIFNKIFDSDLKQYSGQLSDALRSNLFEKPLEYNDSNNQGSATGYTGFLLQSEAVSNWPGLEIDAWNGEEIENNKLALLRLERLSPTLLLGLFKGELDRIRFHMPSEEIHFGFDFDQNIKDKLIKVLRDEQTGDKLDKKVDLSWREPRRRVINIAEMAKNITQKLNLSTLSSDRFALQMVVGKDSAYFTKETEKENKK